MSLAELKTDLHKLIDLIDDDTALHAAKDMLSKKLNKYSDSENAITDQFAEESINKGYAQSEEGKLRPHNELIEELRKKYQDLV